MSLQQMLSRIIWSLIFVGLALTLSYTPPAIEAHTMRPATSPATIARRPLNHLADSACTTCQAQQPTHAFILTLLAALTTLFVMSSLIYGVRIVAHHPLAQPTPLHPQT